MRKVRITCSDMHAQEMNNGNPTTSSRQVNLTLEDVKFIVVSETNIIYNSREWIVDTRRKDVPQKLTFGKTLGLQYTLYVPNTTKS